MSNIVVAGIINRNTGEIIETTCSPKEKTAMALKVRDELGCKHGRGDFMSFEFGIMNHMSYYKTKMINKEPSAFRTLQILNAKYKISKGKLYLEQAKTELALAEEVSQECSALYASDENKKKRLLIDEWTEEGVSEANEEVSQAASGLKNCIEILKSLEADEAAELQGK